MGRRIGRGAVLDASDAALTMGHLRELLDAASSPTISDMRAATRADLGRLAGDRRLSLTRDLDALQSTIDAVLGRRPARSRVLANQSKSSSEAGHLELERRHGEAHALAQHFAVIDGPPDPGYDRVARDTDLHERSATLPFRAHMYDDVAFVSLDFDDCQEGAYRIRHPGLLDDLHRLFVSLWLRSAVKYEPAVGDNALVFVRMLDTGLTDEAAAERLGIPLRTYRRRTAELFRVLGVNSRFAAGRAAERRGLIDLAGVVDAAVIDSRPTA